MKALWILLAMGAGLGLCSEAKAQGVELNGNARFELQSGLMKVSATGGKRRVSNPAVFIELRDQNEIDLLQKQNIAHPSPLDPLYVPPPCPVNVPRIHTPALEIYLPQAWGLSIFAPEECSERTGNYKPTTCIAILGVTQTGNDFSLSLDEERVQDVASQIAAFLLGENPLDVTTTINELVADGKLSADGDRSRLNFRVKATVSSPTLKKDSKFSWAFTLSGVRIATEECDITVP